MRRAWFNILPIHTDWKKEVHKPTKIPSYLIILLLVVLVFGPGVPIPGQEAVFPAEDFVAGWKTPEPLKEFTAANLSEHLTNGSELFLEFGFEKLRLRKYLNEAEADEISIEAYRMQSPEAALGIYLLKCGREFPVEEIDSQVRNSGDRFRLFLLKGNYFVTISNSSGKSSLLEVMIRLANLTMEKIPTAKVEDLFSPLPKENRVEATEMLFRGPYALASFYNLGKGDILLQENKIFGVTAQYVYRKAPLNPDGTPVLYRQLVVRYPNDNACQSAFSHLKTNLDPLIRIISAEKNNLTFEDSQKKFGRISFKKNTISIEVNLPALD